MSLTEVRSDRAAGRRWIGTEVIFEVRFKPAFVFIDGFLAFCDIARAVGIKSWVDTAGSTSEHRGIGPGFGVCGEGSRVDQLQGVSGSVRLSRPRRLVAVREVQHCVPDRIKQPDCVTFIAQAENKI